MGLDMYLYAEKHADNHGFSSDESQRIYQAVSDVVGITPCDDAPMLTVSVCIGYWRKVSAIHAWIVKHCADGVDDCQRIRMDPEDCQELLDTCRGVLADPSKAEELLPPQQGFFFGSTIIDEWYLRGLAHTVEILEKALSLDDVTFFYQASW